jgi:hypothetical protein
LGSFTLLGAAAASLLTALLIAQQKWSWQWTYVAYGAVGVVWALAFFAFIPELSLAHVASRLPLPPIGLALLGNPTGSIHQSYDGCTNMIGHARPRLHGPAQISDFLAAALRVYADIAGAALDPVTERPLGSPPHLGGGATARRKTAINFSGNENRLERRDSKARFTRRSRARQHFGT